jgi:hypothetical protein
MIPASTIAKLALLGLSPEQTEAVAAMLSEVEQATEGKSAAAIEARRANDRERKERQRHVRSREVTGTHGTDCDEPPQVLPPRDNNSTPNSSPSNSSLRSVSVGANAFDREFETEFWPIWPNKVGKPVAKAAFRKARQRSDLAAIIEGVGFYVSAKPSDRPWLNPATFLNQERFNDRPAPSAKPRAGPQPRPNGRETLTQIALGNFFDDEPSDQAPPQFTAPRSNPADRHFDLDLSEQTPKDAGGTVLDFGQQRAVWR